MKLVTGCMDPTFTLPVAVTVHPPFVLISKEIVYTPGPNVCGGGETAFEVKPLLYVHVYEAMPSTAVTLAEGENTKGAHPNASRFVKVICGGVIFTKAFFARIFEQPEAELAVSMT